MTLHVHQLRRCRHITECKDYVCVHDEQFIFKHIIDLHTSSQFLQFLDQWDEEGVHILHLFLPWYRSKWNDVLLMKSDVGREVVVKSNDRPAGLVTFLEWAKSVK